MTSPNDDARSPSFLRHLPFAALVLAVVGVPVVACGGRVGGSGQDDSIAAETTAPSASSSSQAAASSAGAPDLRTVACTAYTAAYNSCLPSSGSTAGCMYYANTAENPLGVEPVASASVAPGCQLEIVPPTADDGASCDHVGCTCTANGWQADVDSGDGFLCPGAN